MNRRTEYDEINQYLQSRIIMVFTSLLQKHSYHFEGFETILDRIYLFVEREVTPNYLSGGLLLRALIEQYVSLALVIDVNHFAYSFDYRKS